jgi:hypothetical protein
MILDGVMAAAFVVFFVVMIASVGLLINQKAPLVDPVAIWHYVVWIYNQTIGLLREISAALLFFYIPLVIFSLVGKT